MLRETSGAKWGQFQSTGRVLTSDDVQPHEWCRTRVSPGKLIAGLLLTVNILLMAAPVASAETRTLKLYFLHTGERAEIAYKRNGRYLKSGLQQINHILRDWRRNEPAEMDPRLLDLLWEVYRQSGSREYIHVVSAYRSPQTNAMLRSRSSGVAKNSQHMLGKAVDFFLPDVKLSKLRAIGLKMQVGGVGYYPRSGSPFVHLDVGGVRHWPRMSRQELLALFPDGETLHIPSDGKPLPGYQQALAAYKARQSSGGAVQVADDTTSRNNRRGLLAMLFGGGADEEEDNAEAAIAVAQRSAPARRQQPQPAQPQPQQAVAPQQPVTPQQPAAPLEEPASPATIIAELPARSLPVPREAPRPDADVGAVVAAQAGVQPEPNANETALEQSVLAALNVPLPTPRPKHQPESTVDVAEAMTEANSDLPMPVAYVTPTRRPDRPAPADAIAELLAAEANKPTPVVVASAPTSDERPEISASDLLAAAPTLASLGNSGRPADGDSAAAKAKAVAALSSATGAESEENAEAASTQLASLRESAHASGERKSDGARVASKGPRPRPDDAAERTPAVARFGGTPTDRVLNAHSFLNTRPRLVASASRFSPELTQAPRVAYTAGFSHMIPVPDARRFTGQAVTFLSLARFDGE
jgi:Uncharacterized protein conserved in bacteria